METLLVHRHIAKDFLSIILPKLKDEGVQLLGCEQTCEMMSGFDLKLAEEKDWVTEYLDLILSVKIVDSLDQAIDHVNTYGSKHSDAIVTNDVQASEQFLSRVDSSTVYVNASTRLRMVLNLVRGLKWVLVPISFMPVDQ